MPPIVHDHSHSTLLVLKFGLLKTWHEPQEHDNPYQQLCWLTYWVY